MSDLAKIWFKSICNPPQKEGIFCGKCWFIRKIIFLFGRKNLCTKFFIFFLLENLKSCPFPTRDLRRCCQYFCCFFGHGLLYVRHFVSSPQHIKIKSSCLLFFSWSPQSVTYRFLLSTSTIVPASFSSMTFSLYMLPFCLLFTCHAFPTTSKININPLSLLNH